jgi:beta-galactosidase
METDYRLELLRRYSLKWRCGKCANGLFMPILLAALFVNKPTSLAAERLRVQTPLVDWQFAVDSSNTPTSGEHTPPDPADWKSITVPHVFRQSGLPDEAAGWYRRTIRVDAAERGSTFYLALEGAASVKNVFVNGQRIGQHRGAFSRCAFDLTPALRFGEDNTLEVRVSNREDEAQNCFSRSTLYYVNGGMFRPACLVKTGAVHVFPDMGSSGVYLTPSNVTSKSVDLDFCAVVKNSLATPAAVTARFVVTDPKGTACGEFVKEQTIPAGETARMETSGKIADPQPWDLVRPALYRVQTIISVDGKAMDEVVERTGFRTIAWKDGRFLLNDREVQFRGVNKHAQNEYAWNAVDDAELRTEWRLMEEMGVNTVRLAHYPHRELEYNIADERGIAVWAENGYAGQVWKDPGNQEKSVTPDGERLTREMVRQNWNHPSILFWSAGNETVLDVVSHYAAVIREERDPNRLITYAANAGGAKNCDFIADNTYDGWYSNHYTQFAELPRNALVSETGCGTWVTHHVPYGVLQWTVDKFEPEEYAGVFTEFRLQTVCRDDVRNRPMFLWWNFREFYNLKFKQNRNTKGLVTLAGAPKDLYFLFQSFFNPSTPVVHLCGRDFFLRSFAPDNGIKAYSNSKALQLKLNGVTKEKLSNGSYRLPDSERINKKDGTRTKVPGVQVANVFFWKTPLQPGKNVIEVSDEDGHSDRMVVYQKPADGNWPSAPGDLLQDLQSSNAESSACFVDRPVHAQGAFYIDVDGSSDNTFDLLPKEVEGASWIATRRLSDSKLKTDLSWRINPSSKGATVFVIFSTGKYPTVTLKPAEPVVAAAADSMRAFLKSAGFQPGKADVVWRDHEVNRAEAELWSRECEPGEKLNIPGHTLDYAILLRAR